jgi:hypothetical protein
MAEEKAMSASPNGNAVAGAVSKVKAQAPGSEMDTPCKRATNGEKSCLPEVRTLFADGSRGKALREANGDPPELL